MKGIKFLVVLGIAAVVIEIACVVLVVGAVVMFLEKMP